MWGGGNFDRIMAFLTDSFEAKLQYRVEILCNNSSQSFQAINLKLCTDVTSILKMRM